MNDTQPPVAAAAHPLKRIFIGPDGLRAGWGILLFLIIAALVSMLAGYVVNAMHLVPKAGPNAAKGTVTFTPRSQYVQEGVVLLAVLVATWGMSKIERRPFGEYGLGGSSRWPWQFLQGFVLGFATLSLVVWALHLSHAIVFDGQLLHGMTIWRYAFIWMGGFLLVGFFEEMLFRGYVQFTLARGIGYGGWGFWISAFLLNFGFGLVHGNNPGESPIGLFLAGFVGFVFCLSLWYTRSLWWAIGWHATWDWAESYFYGTADSGTYARGHLFSTHPQGPLLLSGGATGPEGSYYAAAAVVLTAGIIWLTLRHEHSRSTNQALVNPID